VLFVIEEARFSAPVRELLMPGLPDQTVTKLDEAPSDEARDMIWRREILGGVPMNVFVKNGKVVQMNPGHVNADKLETMTGELFA